jgi:hypothetical protein
MDMNLLLSWLFLAKTFDKAFEKTTYGKVLGIWFRSSDLTWSLTDGIPDLVTLFALTGVKNYM